MESLYKTITYCLFFVLLFCGGLASTKAWTQTDTPVFVGFIGGYQGDGKTYSPSGLATDTDNNVWVVDAFSHRIQKFDNLGNFLLKVGDFSTTVDGKFNNPRDVATDNMGNVYVTDTLNFRIQKYSPTGEYLSKFGSNGTLGGQFVNPAGIDIDLAGYIYVVDTVNHRIQKFDANWAFQWAIGKDVINGGDTGFEICTDPSTCKAGVTGSGNIEGTFNYPSYIAVNSLGDIFVTDGSNYRIQKFTKHGVFERAFGRDVANPAGGTTYENCTSDCKIGVSGSGNGEFSSPQGIAIDKDNNIYIVDAANNRIQKFDVNGNYLGQFGSFGYNDGYLSTPVGLAMDSAGDIFVSNQGSFRIHKYSSSGTFILGFGSNKLDPGNFGLNLDSFNWDSDGNLFVADRYNGTNERIQIYDPNLVLTGQYLIAATSAYDIVFDDSDNAYFVDRFGNKILKYDTGGNFVSSFGSSGSSNNNFSAPSAMYKDSQGNLIIADTGNGRVVNYSMNGTLNFMFGWDVNSSDGTTVFERCPRVSNPGDVCKAGTYADPKYGGKIRAPFAMYVDKYDNIWVSDASSKRINKFNSNGDFLIMYGYDVDGSNIDQGFETCSIAANCQTGIAGSYLSTPYQVLLDSDDNVWVVDPILNKIVKFTQAGVILTSFGTKGIYEYEFNAPNRLKFSVNGDLYINELQNARIQYFTFDKIPPLVQTNTYTLYTNNQNPTLTGYATDNLTAITSVEYQVNNISGTWSNCNAIDNVWNELSEDYSCAIVSPLSEGLHTVYVRATDSKTNTTDNAEYPTYSFTVDTIPPIDGSIVINSNDTYTNTVNVTLNLSANDATTGVSQMIVCNEADFNGCSYESYATTKSWALAVGDGPKTVYVRFKDNAGNESASAFDTIVLDTTAPEKLTLASIGFIDPIVVADDVTYFFTSQRPIIRGMGEIGATVYFKWTDGFTTHTYTTLVGSDARFEIIIDNPFLHKGKTTLSYYQIDLAGNKSAERTVTLIVGIENFPEDLLRRMGLIQDTLLPIITLTASPTTKPDIIVGPTTLPQTGEEATNTIFVIRDQAGRILVNAQIIIDGKTYTTNSKGEITVKGLVASNYDIKIRYNDRDYVQKLQIASSQKLVYLTVNTKSDFNLLICGIFSLFIIFLLIYRYRKKRHEK